jgi:hypothetical protein
MTTLVLEADPVAVDVNFDGDHFTVSLTDGRALAVPVEWYPRLYHASGSERNNWQLLGGGYAIAWPDLDEHIGVGSLLAGRRSGESERSIERWLDRRR